MSGQEKGQQDQTPYVTKILTGILSTEQKNLEFFEKNMGSSDPLVVRQAKGNIPSNKNRVEELTSVLEFLRTYKKEHKQK